MVRGEQSSPAPHATKRVLARAAASAKEKEQRECAGHQPRRHAFGRGTFADGAPTAITGRRRGTSIKRASGSPSTGAGARLAHHAAVASGCRAGAEVASALNILGRSALASALDVVGGSACGANRHKLARTRGYQVSRGRSCEERNGKSEGTKKVGSHGSGPQQFPGQVRVCPRAR